MTIAVFIVVVIVIAILLAIAVDKVPQIAPYNGLLKALIFVFAALAIANRAGVF